MTFVKGVIVGITNSLTYIFNLSFQTGQFPHEMNLAQVTPQYETGDRHHFTN